MIEDIQTKYGLTGLLIVAVLYFVFHVAKFVFDLTTKESKKEKQETTNALRDNSVAIQHLTSSVEKLNASVSEINKIKLDTKRNYDGLKFLSGKIGGTTWSEVREEITKENPTP